MTGHSSRCRRVMRGGGGTCDNRGFGGGVGDRLRCVCVSVLPSLFSGGIGMTGYFVLLGGLRWPRMRWKASIFFASPSSNKRASVWTESMSTSLGSTGSGFALLRASQSLIRQVKSKRRTAADKPCHGRVLARREAHEAVLPHIPPCTLCLATVPAVQYRS